MVEREAHIEVLNKHKLTMLKKAAQAVMDSGINEVNIQIFKDNINDYNNWQKLRLHGLIHHVKINGIVQRGKWLITRNGWSFLRGEISLPKKIIVKDNRIISKDARLIHIRDVYRGSEEVHTTFEYFDENNRPVGWKPTAPPKPPENATLDLDGLSVDKVQQKDMAV